MNKSHWPEVKHPEAFTGDSLSFLKENTAKESKGRWLAAVSMVAGGSGFDLPAECLGDITFLWNGQVIRFNGQGKQITGGPPGAAAGAFPLVRVLNPDQLLKANRITWKVYGGGNLAILVIVADDVPVFEVPFPLVGSDTGTYEGSGRLYTPEETES